MTHTIALQEQYRKTAPWAFASKGKRNYDCGHPHEGDRPKIAKVLGVSNLNAEQCDDHLECETPESCPYFASIRAAAGQSQAVLNYAYAVRVCQSPAMTRGICTAKPDALHSECAAPYVPVPAMMRGSMLRATWAIVTCSCVS